ncbi:Protein kinase domain - like 10 [Theobroma cacao]|nr:Protein kinase domain - like 10 [Theobroma cacao]
MDNTQASKFFTSKPVIIMFSVAEGLFGFGLITRIISRILKNQKKKEKIENQDKETETAMELARTLRNLLAYDRTQPGPHVVAAMDEETGLEKQTVERFIEHMLQEKPARLSSQVLEIFTSNYSTKLGEGAYGAVYKGHFPNGGQVAVKVLNNQGIDKRIEEQFMAEVNTIGRTYHRNLVRLYGFCFEAKTKALVYEYMENGSLDKLLFEKKHNIEWDKLYEIAIGAARGLEYLHHFSHGRIIHYDIKPANVLLDSNFCPKIADFGLAKLYNRDSTNVTRSRVGGTPGYAAPEVWMPFPVSYKCDVYSFGVMLFEIV